MKISCLPNFKKLLSKLRSIITLALWLPLLAFALQGCSTLRLAYGNAPTAAYWYLDSYLDFSDAQKPAVRAALTQIHQWHQQTQLPAYVQTLQRLQTMAARDISTDQACSVYTQVQETLLDTGEGMAELIQASTFAGTAAGPAKALLSTLDARQLQHLERKLSKSNADYRKDYVNGPPRQVFEKRLERLVSRAEMLYGPLDKSQEALIAERLMQSGYQADLAYAERLRRQQDLLQALRTSAGSAPLAVTSATPVSAAQDASLKAVLQRWSESPDAAYKQQSDKLRTRNCETMTLLHNSTSAVQRQHAQQVLRNYVQDLQGFTRS